MIPFPDKENLMKQFRTMTDINKYIEKKYNNGLQLCHSDGYFWFFDQHTLKEPPKSIYVCYIKDLKHGFIDDAIAEWEALNCK